MADHIRVDFDLLSEAQRRLTAVDERLREVSRKWSQALDPLIDDQVWVGESRTAYNVKNNELVQAQNALRESLREAARQMGEIARIMREAEEEAGQG